MKMLKSVAMNYSAASKVAEMKKIEKEEERGIERYWKLCTKRYMLAAQSSTNR